MELAVDEKSMHLMHLSEDLLSPDLVIKSRLAIPHSKHLKRLLTTHMPSFHCARGCVDRSSPHVVGPKRMITDCLLAILHHRRLLSLLHHLAQRSLHVKSSL